MDKVVVNSPAKINIGLNILGKRDDGFHNLETIFYPIKLSDKITFIKSNTFSFRTNNNFLSSQSSNLIIKAKDLLENRTKFKINVDIHLEKNIPIGAGLGGGSSNGAAALSTLNKMFDFNLSQETLHELALELGSDVPFFLHPVPAFAASRGEILQKISLQLKGYLVLINPGIHISTKWAFENCKLKNNRLQTEKIIEGFNEKDDLTGKITNDFEGIVFEKYPQIKMIKDNLIETGAYFSLMTGTGSTVYGFFYSKKDAESAMGKFPEEYFAYIERL